MGVVIIVGVAAWSSEVAGVLPDSCDSLLLFGLTGVPAAKGSGIKMSGLLLLKSKNEGNVNSIFEELSCTMRTNAVMKTDSRIQIQNTATVWCVVLPAISVTCDVVSFPAMLLLFNTIILNQNLKQEHCLKFNQTTAGYHNSFDYLQRNIGVTLFSRLVNVTLTQPQLVTITPLVTCTVVLRQFHAHNWLM